MALKKAMQKVPELGGDNRFQADPAAKGRNAAKISLWWGAGLKTYSSSTAASAVA